MLSPHWRSLIPLFLLLLVLAACGGSSTQQTKKPTPTPTPSPTPGPGQQLLAKVGKNLSTAKTLHAVLDTRIDGETFNGVINTEVWNASPNKNRTVVLQSDISQFPTGSITVTDGKQVWQYDPVKKVVYTGPVTTTSGTPMPGGFGSGGQNQFILNLVQSVFTNSKATLISSSAKINGHDAYQVHVTSDGTGTGPANFPYDGDVYIDKTTQLPLRVNLTVQGVARVTLDLPKLELNTHIDDKLFTFTPPPGTKVLPLEKASATAGTGTITLAQAQQQAGYHLLSIPASQTAYELEGVTALGSPGSQIFTLNYIKGNIAFTIAEGKPLANLTGSGQQVTIRNTTGMLSMSNGTTTLAWTENGVGIRISGPLSKDEVVGIANVLS